MTAVYPNQPEIASINRPQHADFFGTHLGEHHELGPAGVGE
jgi:hypothetical protein